MDEADQADLQQESHRQLLIPSAEVLQSKNLVFAAILVCVNQVGNVGSGELMQFQEDRGAHRFDSPYFSIWFNHSATGVSALLMLALQLKLQQKTLLEMLFASGYSANVLARDSVMLTLLFQLYNMCWAESISRT